MPWLQCTHYRIHLLVYQFDEISFFQLTFLCSSSASVYISSFVTIKALDGSAVR